MKLNIGDIVVYPCQGPCLISSVVEKVIADKPKSFYRLLVLDESRGELFIPVDRIQAIGIRLPLKKAEIPKLLNQFMLTAIAAKDWKQRSKDISKLFTSGSAFDLAEVINLLTTLSKVKTLSLRESWTLGRARKLLVCEIAEVMGETKGAAEEQMDWALNGRPLVTTSGIIISSPLSSISQTI
jgi:RNA polymerase-interacting CarD/CdnL/TRCF family regulator